MTAIHVDDNNFEKEVMDSKIPVIVDFYADWCGPRQMMKPVFESLSNQYTDKLKFVKVDTGENQMFAGKFGVQGIPTLIIVHKSKEVDRIVGFSDESLLKKRIDSILAKIK